MFELEPFHCDKRPQYGGTTSTETQPDHITTATTTTPFILKHKNSTLITEEGEGEVEGDETFPLLDTVGPLRSVLSWVQATGVVTMPPVIAAPVSGGLPTISALGGGSGGDGSSGNNGINSNSSSAAGAQGGKRRSNIPSLVAAIMAALTTGGTTYAFGLYGSALKRTLHLRPSEVDTISTAFFFAGLFSWIPGLMVDRFGTRFTISMGGMTGASALMTYWLVATQRVLLPRSWIVPVLSALGIFIFLSNAAVTGSVFKIIVSTCGAGTKGSAVGVAKGYVGLGSGAYAVLFECIRTPGQSSLDFLPMAACFALLCATTPALCLLPTKAVATRDIMVDEATPLHFRTLFTSLVLMAGLVIGNSMMELFFDSSDAEPATDDLYSPNSTKLDASTIRNVSIGQTATGGRRLPMFFLLVSVWLGPILSLLFLPRRRPEDDVTMLRQDDEDEEMENNGTVTTISTDESSSVQVEQSLFMLSQKKQKFSDSMRGDVSMQSLARARSPARSDSLPMNNSISMDEEEHNRLLNDSSGRIASAHSASGSANAASNVSAPGGGGSSAPTALDNPNLNLLEMLQTPSALFMLWSMTILVGAGTVMTNNMGEMVEALGYNENVAPASLALFSVAQAASRVLTGAISEWALNWQGSQGRCWVESGIPRPFFLVLASAVGFLAHLMLGVADSQGMFVFGSALAGIAFGMVWPLMVLITGEVFGTAHTGANYLFYDGFSSAIGTLLLTKMLAQAVYEGHIPKDAPNQNVCHGVECFRMTHMVVAMLALTCLGTSTAMVYTSRKIYNRRSLHTA